MSSNIFYWGKFGAGILPICYKTGRILIPLRSEYVNEPCLYGVWGGKGDEEIGETEKDAEVVALREFREEAEFNERIKLIPAFVYEDGNFKYFNFIGILDEEFTPDIEHNEHSWETDSACWVTYPELLALALRNKLHFGLVALLNDEKSQNIINKAINGSKFKKGGNVNGDDDIFEGVDWQEGHSTQGGSSSSGSAGSQGSQGDKPRGSKGDGEGDGSENTEGIKNGDKDGDGKPDNDNDENKEGDADKKGDGKPDDGSGEKQEGDSSEQGKEKSGKGDKSEKSDGEDKSEKGNEGEGSDKSKEGKDDKGKEKESKDSDDSDEGSEADGGKGKSKGKGKGKGKDGDSSDGDDGDGSEESDKEKEGDKQKEGDEKEEKDKQEQEKQNEEENEDEEEKAQFCVTLDEHKDKNIVPRGSIGQVTLSEKNEDNTYSIWIEKGDNLIFINKGYFAVVGDKVKYLQDIEMTGIITKIEKPQDNGYGFTEIKSDLDGREYRIHSLKIIEIIPHKEEKSLCVALIDYEDKKGKGFVKKGNIGIVKLSSADNKGYYEVTFSNGEKGGKKVVVVAKLLRAEFVIVGDKVKFNNSAGDVTKGVVLKIFGSKNPEGDYASHIKVGDGSKILIKNIDIISLVSDDKKEVSCISLVNHTNSQGDVMFGDVGSVNLESKDKDGLYDLTFPFSAKDGKFENVIWAKLKREEFTIVGDKVEYYFPNRKEENKKVGFVNDIYLLRKKNGTFEVEIKVDEANTTDITTTEIIRVIEQEKDNWKPCVIVDVNSLLFHGMITKCNKRSDSDYDVIDDNTKEIVVFKRKNIAFTEDTVKFICKDCEAPAILRKGILNTFNLSDENIYMADIYFSNENYRYPTSVIQEVVIKEENSGTDCIVINLGEAFHGRVGSLITDSGNGTDDEFQIKLTRKGAYEYVWRKRKNIALVDDIVMFRMPDIGLLEGVLKSFETEGDDNTSRMATIYSEAKKKEYQVSTNLIEEVILDDKRCVVVGLSHPNHGDIGEPLMQDPDGNITVKIIKKGTESKVTLARKFIAFVDDTVSFKYLTVELKGKLLKIYSLNEAESKVDIEYGDIDGDHKVMVSSDAILKVLIDETDYSINEKESIAWALIIAKCAKQGYVFNMFTNMIKQPVKSLLDTVSSQYCKLGKSEWRDEKWVATVKEELQKLDIELFKYLLAWFAYFGHQTEDGKFEVEKIMFNLMNKLGLFNGQYFQVNQNFLWYKKADINNEKSEYQYRNYENKSASSKFTSWDYVVDFAEKTITANTYPSPTPFEFVNNLYDNLIMYIDPNEQTKKLIEEKSVVIERSFVNKRILETALNYIDILKSEN